MAAPVFTFTAIPDQDETQLQQRFDKVAHYLERQLGVPVRYIPVKSYSAAISAFRNNQVQLAWFGGLSGVQARRLVQGSEVIAQGYEDQFFKTFFIANYRTRLPESTRLPPVLSDYTFAFGSKGSTSGRLMPEFYLRQYYHKDPAAIFKRVGFSGDHSRTISLVQSGAYDLGAVNYKVWERELADGKINLDKVSVIWETPTYSDYQWTLRGDVDEQWGSDFKQKITDALVTLDDPDLLQSFPRSRFVPAKSSDYQAIYEVAKTIGIID
ncbi:MAG: putative selenate ABC transporter substrate-binding protein [Gammaproteobacteria bacterium]|nr:putative selenate ABC transporter substrate-binding protein [Gammaproteobacteria bacterium]